MLFVPLTAHPIGWIILGCGGYFLYQNGKKKGMEVAAAPHNTAVQPAEAPRREES